MDFEKASDRVDREVMIETMRSMNFGEKFIQMVELLYEGSVARVIVNGELGPNFKTEGGVKQGCPLSPLLFIVVLELLAIEMRESVEVEGITINKEEKRQEKRARIEERGVEVERSNREKSGGKIEASAAGQRAAAARTSREPTSSNGSNSNNHINNHTNINININMIEALAAWMR